MSGHQSICNRGRRRLTEATELAAIELSAAYDRIRQEGAPTVTFEGGLLRPILSLAGASHDGGSDQRLWAAALAVQLAHEASLVHDDVIDDASMRRGRSTIVASGGVTRALIDGDHLLTTAYCAAAATESGPFIAHFARSVERTVAAEKLQGALLGSRVDGATCERIAAGKSGELTACALAAAALLEQSERASAHVRLGCEVGVVYQMLDDFLDYCSATGHGKPTLGDYCQGRWTWLLDELPAASFGLVDGEILAQLHAPRDEWGGATAFARVIGRLQGRLDDLERRCAELLPGDMLLPTVIDGWRARVLTVATNETAARREVVRRAIGARVAQSGAGAEGGMSYLARNSLSFRFASRLLPPEEATRIARVYAFCRFTDDLVDEPASDHVSSAEMLREWVEMSRSAYSGSASGVALVDVPMAEMAARCVPFDHVAQLAEAMRMDLVGTSYDTLADLRCYTYRAAGVVGLWLASLAGVRDHRVLENAERLGHAMQLTNIVRDVGEDWKRGRLYLPADLLARHGLTRDDVGAIASGERSIDAAYRAVVEEFMQLADEEYRVAFGWITALPPQLQPCMAVAARVYSGIHDALRRDGHDNIRRRARTSWLRKAHLAKGALTDLRRVRVDGMPVLVAVNG